MVWISRSDIDRGHRDRFRSRFLGIADPWNDNTLREWNGYVETWHFDAEGRRVADAPKAARSEEMIPLALYSLDHPKAPFLLVDFRSPWKPAAREVARRTVEEVPLTILGVATFTNWQAWGAQFAWNSIRGRQGAATYRPARLRAAAAVRQVVPASPQLQPEMRLQLEKRLRVIEPSSSARYEALIAAAQSPDRLARQIERDRGRELAKLLHPTRTGLLNVATVATLGVYRYRVRPTAERLDLLDRERRVARAVRVIEQALAESPRIEMCGNFEEVRRAALDLAVLRSVRRSAIRRSAYLLTRLTEQTRDEQVRQEFLALLHNFEQPGADVLTGGGED
jgi:hypothetical protein